MWMTKSYQIALDSNIFRNQKFIDYLIFKKDSLSIALPIIVQLEVGYFYRLKGHSWKVFETEMKKFDCKMLGWDCGSVSSIVSRSYDNRRKLPFRDHIRDYIIGVQVEKEERGLITYNTSHFKWLNHIEVKTPEEFIRYVEE